MKRLIIKYLLALAAFLVVFTLMRPVFMLVYSRFYTDVPAGDIFSAVLHGFPMDLSISAYLSAVPALLLIAASAFGPRRWIRVVEKVYYIIAAVLVAGIFIIDLVLYGYWGYRLDTTPFVYFASSPSIALASASAGQAVGGVAGLLVVAAICYAVFYFVAIRYRYPAAASVGQRVRRSVLAVLLAGLLVLPMRGSLTVATMNLSRAYFSDNMRLNHAAVNPAFSLLYSLSLPDRYGEQFRFFSTAGEAQALVDALNASQPLGDPLQLVDVERPDIYLIVLESFSSHLMPSLGGDSVAMRLDSIARDGVLFTNVYASSFRTDRGLAAVLSAVPAQPTESVLKHVTKAEHLPSIAGELSKAGYACSYYYGGDRTFSNILAYLRASGFTKIIQDKDFPISQRISKWGAPDGEMLKRALADIKAEDAAGRTAPRFAVLQTLSSHEPFDVPYDNPRFPEGPLRAFAYTDSCVGAFVDSLRQSPRWDNSLVVLVPDHYGCWPQDIAEMNERHRIPMVLAGGALSDPEKRVSRINRIASQTDLAATLLGQLGLPADAFPFSRNAADTTDIGYAFFSERDAARLLTPEGEATLTVVADQIDGDPGLAEQCKAYLQRLYDYIDSL